MRDSGAIVAQFMLKISDKKCSLDVEVPSISVGQFLVGFLRMKRL